ncbi:MAG: hypothetical protein FD122_3402 [Stygiobacter sp.]|nr:MAG: hypothetical protein FD122_3402 [Stygiobacter sp.]KAF0214622.1 MAG: hypothetical protein FD178_2254 [Ignavibacteria bacterium]
MIIDKKTLVHKLKIDLKQNGYFFTVSIVSQLLVIAAYKITGR